MQKNRSSASDAGVTIVNTGCCQDCGGRCVLKAHVKDGRIIRFESDTGTAPQIRACARGRAYRHRLYFPERPQHPMRLVGERGEGRFEGITWDEAVDAVAENLNRINVASEKSKFLSFAHFRYTLALASRHHVLCLAGSHHDHQPVKMIGIRAEIDHLVVFPQPQ